MVTATGDAVVDKVIAEQFKLFRERFTFANTDEELDRVAKEIGCRSVADLRTVALFMLFMRGIDENVGWN